METEFTIERLEQYIANPLKCFKVLEVWVPQGELQRITSYVGKGTKKVPSYVRLYLGN